MAQQDSLKSPRNHLVIGLALCAVGLLPAAGCSPCANDPCDDGLACNGIETCMDNGPEAVCGPGVPVECPSGTVCAEPDGICEDPCDGFPCDDDDPCTTDTCMVDAEGTPMCLNMAECDDQDMCTENDLCSDGVCVGTPIEGCCQTDMDCVDELICLNNACSMPPCVAFESVVAVNNVISPGVQSLDLLILDGTVVGGTVDLEFRDIQGADYSRGSVPVPHIGIGEGQLDVDLGSLMLNDGPGLMVEGLHLFPLFSESINSGRPLNVLVLGGSGKVLDTHTFNSVPDNVGNPNDPTALEIPLDGLPEPACRVRIDVPQAAFLTIQGICLTP